ncbi:MAG: sugar phosphate isomerase/epimerase family protein [Bacteroidota bacterium]
MNNRRNFLRSLAGILGAGMLPVSLKGIPRPAGNEDGQKANFKFCLNTSTIRGQEPGLWSDIEVAQKAGYDSVELWLGDIRRYLDERGKKEDLRNKIADSGLTFENAIAFPEWIVDDPDRRKNALEDMKNNMDLLADLGCKRIAAPPVGATEGKVLDLFTVAERYRAVLEIGENSGILPVLEVWGHSVNLHALGQAVSVIIESGHPDACILPDVYHLHRGGSDFSGLRYLSSQAVSMFHINDYPPAENRTALTDADRVFPGDGTAPFPFIMNELKRINPEMVLSLELFNREYWKQDALAVARRGLQKMKEVASYLACIGDLSVSH